MSALTNDEWRELKGLKALTASKLTLEDVRRVEDLSQQQFEYCAAHIRRQCDAVYDDVVEISQLDGSEFQTADALVGEDLPEDLPMLRAELPRLISTVSNRRSAAMAHLRRLQRMLHTADMSLQGLRAEYAGLSPTIGAPEWKITSEFTVWASRLVQLRDHLQRAANYATSVLEDLAQKARALDLEANLA